jgi:hypothetical protein
MDDIHKFSRFAAVYGDLYQVKTAGIIRYSEKGEVKSASGAVAPHLFQRQITCRRESGVLSYGFDFNENDGQSVKSNNIQFPAFESEISCKDVKSLVFQQFNCNIFPESAQLDMGFAGGGGDEHL